MLTFNRLLLIPSYNPPYCTLTEIHYAQQQKDNVTAFYTLI